MKKIVLAGRNGFGEFDDTLYFDFKSEPFADLIGFRWLEDTAGGAVTDCDDLDGNYIETIDNIIINEGASALDCTNEDYRQIYYELFGFGLIDETELNVAREKYSGGKNL